MTDESEPLHEIAKTVYRVVIDDGPNAGAVARFREPGIGVFTSLLSMRGTADVDPEPLFDLLADYLVSWNLSRNGEPIAPDAAAVRALSPPLFIQLLELWIEAIGGTTDAPLESPSPNGGQPAEASIPMEPLSPNPVPSSTPT